jgi:hypothetical protein
MSVDRKALLALWKTDEVPACDEGMELARPFLETCGRALESTEDEQFSIVQRWRAFFRHRSACDKCNEV